MSSGRPPKRARKKQFRNERRQLIAEAMRRRRRQRLVLLGISMALILGGVGVLYLTRGGGKPAAKPSATPSALAGPAATPEPVACGAKLPSTAGSRKKAYSKPADQNLDPDKTYIWKLDTSCGVIRVKLDVEKAPKTSNSIAFLTREHFYDGLVFHRISPGFVIQGGDPKGDGSGGSGYQIVEPLPDGFKYQKGFLAMAKGGTDPPGSSGSQFFIVTSDKGAQALTPDYAYAGRVTKGSSVVDEITELATGDMTPPKAFAYIERATIEIEE